MAAGAVGVTINCFQIKGKGTGRLGSIDVKPDTTISGQLGDVGNWHLDACWGSKVTYLNDPRSGGNEGFNALQVTSSAGWIGLKYPYTNAFLFLPAHPGYSTSRVRMGFKDYLIAWLKEGQP